MATTKKATTEKAAVAASTPATETVTEAPVKKAPAKKVAPKKPAPKKVAPKKPAALKPAEAPAVKAEATATADTTDTKVNFFVEFGGVQVAVDEVIKNVKATYGKDAKEVSVYLKPEESKAYFVADGNEGEMDVFFC